MAQIIRSVGSDGKEVLSNILDRYTGEYSQYKEETLNAFGQPLTDAMVVADGGIIFIKKYGKFFKRVFDAVNPKWYGAKGDNVTDDRIAVERACNTGYNVHFPDGRYIMERPIKVAGGCIYSGESNTRSTIVRKGEYAIAGSVGVFYLESASATTFVSDTTFIDLGFDGLVSEQGHGQYTHLLALHGTENTKILNCKFFGFRGDGVYLGSGKQGGLERHNNNVTIQGCIFDGDIKENRNGISIIDGNGLVIDNNLFTRIGNPILSRSVGAIDFERNPGFALFAKTSKIINNQFIDVDTTNTSAVTIFTTPNTENKDFHIIQNNYIDNCYWGISIVNDDTYKPVDIDSTKIVIDSNSFHFNMIAVRAAGRGVNITNNTFKGNSTRISNIDVSPNVNTVAGTYAQDIKINNNVFDFCEGTGVIQIYSVRGLEICDNVFTNTKSILYFLPDAQVGAYRVLDGIVVTGNRIRRKEPSTGNVYLFNIPAGFNLNNILINSTCLERDNFIEGRIIRTINTGINFPESSTVLLPTTGTWKNGDKVYFGQNTTNNYILECIRAGTYLTDGVHSIGATNGINAFTYANIQNTNLRIGQILDITGGVGTFRITSIDFATGMFYTDVAYTGTTGTVNAQQSPPLFTIRNIDLKVQLIDSTQSIIPNNNYTEYRGALTANRTWTISAKPNGFIGQRLIFTNSSSAFTWTITPDTGVTFNGASTSIIISPNSTLELVESTANGWTIVSIDAPVTGFLPLSGGTLTGTLNGTIANFSGLSKYTNNSAITGTVDKIGALSIGTPSTVGSSLFVNTPSLSTSFGSGLGIEGRFSGTTSIIDLKASGVSSGGGYASILALWTSLNGTFSERMRLTQPGNLLIGSTTDNGAKLQVEGKATVLTAPTNPTDVVRKTELDLKSDLASPTFTGVPAAPTATAGTNTTQLATTAFVTTADNLKAPLASPTFTGTPLVPTAAVSTNNTQAASTAFVLALLQDRVKYGSTVVTFDGTQTVFSIPHGMGAVPTSIGITFGDASNDNFVKSVRTLTSTNIVLTCDSPPLAGSQTVYWQAFK